MFECQESEKKWGLVISTSSYNWCHIQLPVFPNTIWILLIFFRCINDIQQSIHNNRPESAYVNGVGLTHTWTLKIATFKQELVLYRPTAVLVFGRLTKKSSLIDEVCLIFKSFLFVIYFKQVKYKLNRIYCVAGILSWSI